MKFDRDKFYAGWRKEFGDLSSQQLKGLNFLLTSIENDAHLLDRIEWAGYMLGTTYLETAHTMQPIHEYGSHSYFVRRYGSQTAVGKRLGNKTAEDGATYSGEGDVQLTGLRNFTVAETALRREYPTAIAEFEQRTGKKFDLTVGDQPGDQHDPENAGDPVIAYCIMSYGMRTGMFTGRKLSNYDLTSHSGQVAARHIINGQDHAALIAGYAEKFVRILNNSTVAADSPLPSVPEQPSDQTPEADDLESPTSTAEEPTPPDSDISQPLTLTAEPEPEPEPKPSLWDRVMGYKDKVNQASELTSSVGNISQGSSLMTWTTKTGGWGMLSVGLFRGDVIVLLVGLALVGIAIWYYNHSKNRANARTIAAPPTPVIAEVKV